MPDRIEKRPAVFLDRDGTINEDVGYLSDPDAFVLIKGASEAIRRLNEAGVKVIVVTNQSGVGRGYYGEADLTAVNGRMASILEAAGARIDAVYWCPHHPEDDCACRKPGTEMATRAALEHAIDLELSYVVGDKASDIEMAGRIGARGVLVLTGSGGEEIKKLEYPPDRIAADITEAVRWILDDMKGQDTAGRP